MTNKNFLFIALTLFVFTSIDTQAQLNLEVVGDGLISGQLGIGTNSPETGRKVEINAATSLVDDIGILTVKNTANTGINSNAYAIEGINDVDDSYGVGLYGKGGRTGVMGEVTATGFEVYYGIKGCVTGGTGTNYGVYGEANNENIAYAGYFNGNLTYTGDLNKTSDRKLKHHIKTYHKALEQVMLLQVKTYQFQNDKYPTMNLAKGQQFGFIAQELQEVLPQLVSQNVHATGDPSAEKIEYLGVNYMGLIPVLTKAIQEQQVLIIEKESQIKTLQSQVTEQNARLVEQEIRLKKLEQLLLSE